MNNIKEVVLKTIKKEKLIQPGDKIVLAVSGGPDSICMLNVLNEIVKTNLSHKSGSSHQGCQSNPEQVTGLVVAHVNHMIREEADEDEKFVKQFCQKLGIEFYSKSIDVKKLANNNKIGLEEAGRIARYNYFDEVLKKTGANKIAIAHNKNDNVETIIMHVLRGSGTYGLHGIEAKNGKYIRPLIECDRSQIEQYCIDNNINARIDKTNFENDYTRNKVRNIVVPYIKKEFNPNISDTICRLSNLIKDEDLYIEKQVQKAYEEIKIDDKKDEIVLDLKKFNKQEKVIKSRLVLYTINRLFGTTNGIEKIHIEDIIKLCENNIGNKYLTPNKNIKIFVKSRKNSNF